MFEDIAQRFGAVGAGDALFTAVSRAARPDNRKLSSRASSSIFKFAAEIDKLAARLPEFLRELSAFPTATGASM